MNKSLEDKTIKMQETNSSVYGAEAASKVHKELKKIGGVKPPREFVFMDRAAIGMGSVFLHLDAKVNWYREFNNLIENFSVKDLHNRQREILKNVKIKKNVQKCSKPVSRRNCDKSQVFFCK